MKYINSNMRSVLLNLFKMLLIFYIIYFILSVNVVILEYTRLIVESIFNYNISFISFFTRPIFLLIYVMFLLILVSSFMFSLHLFFILLHMIKYFLINGCYKLINFDFFLFNIFKKYFHVFSTNSYLESINIYWLVSGGLNSVSWIEICRCTFLLFLEYVLVSYFKLFLYITSFISLLVLNSVYNIGNSPSFLYSFTNAISKKNFLYIIFWMFISLILINFLGIFRIIFFIKMIFIIFLSIQFISFFNLSDYSLNVYLLELIYTELSNTRSFICVFYSEVFILDNFNLSEHLPLYNHRGDYFIGHKFQREKKDISKRHLCYTKFGLSVAALQRIENAVFIKRLVMSQKSYNFVNNEELVRLIKLFYHPTKKIILQGENKSTLCIFGTSSHRADFDPPTDISGYTNNSIVLDKPTRILEVPPIKIVYGDFDPSVFSDELMTFSNPIFHLWMNNHINRHLVYSVSNLKDSSVNNIVGGSINIKKSIYPSSDSNEYGVEIGFGNYTCSEKNLLDIIKESTIDQAVSNIAARSGVYSHMSTVKYNKSYSISHFLDDHPQAIKEFGFVEGFVSDID